MLNYLSYYKLCRKCCYCWKKICTSTFEAAHPYKYIPSAASRDTFLVKTWVSSFMKTDKGFDDIDKKK